MLDFNSLSPQAHLDALISELKAQKKGNEYESCCPAHDETNPSFSFRLRDDKILFHCFAGCTQAQILSALSARGLWNNSQGNSRLFRATLPSGVPFYYPPASVLRKQNKTPSSDNQKTYVAHYPYRSASGEIIGHVVRYERNGKKDTIPFFKQWDNGDWRSGHALLSGRPLYGIEQLGKSIKIIIIVEGEKCADFINTTLPQRCVAITWVGGSKSVRKCDWSILSQLLSQDVKFVYWMDLDKAGALAMKNVYECINESFQNVSTHVVSHYYINPNSIPKYPRLLGADCVDYLGGNDTYHSDDNYLADLLNLYAVPVIDDGKDFISALKEFGFYEERKNGSDTTKVSTSNVVLDSEDNTRSADIRADDISAEEREAPTNENSSFSVDNGFNDVGNAIRFVNRYASISRFTKQLGWLFWNGNTWTVDETDDVYNRATEVVRDIAKEAKTQKKHLATRTLNWCNTSQNLARVRNMVTLAGAHPKISTKIEQFDTHKMLFSTINGTVDLETGKLRHADKADLLTQTSAVLYDPSATCEAWLHFLDQIFNGDCALIDYIQRLFGYCLTGLVDEQIMPLLWGSGQNGKTVIVELLHALMNTYSHTTSPKLVLLNAHGEEGLGDNAVAILKGKRLVVCSEISEGQKLNEARVKELTGGDTVQARFLYKEFFNFKPQFKIILRTNHRPVIRGADIGIWRRIHCIPFNAHITKPDKKLPQKLQAEFSGIFNWILQGCLDWQRDGLRPPSQVTNAIEVYRRDMDPIGEFIDDNCVTDASALTRSKLIYEAYKDWMKEQGEKPQSIRWLSMQMRERGFLRVKNKDGRMYRGLRLRNDGIRDDVNTPPSFYDPSDGGGSIC